MTVNQQTLNGNWNSIKGQVRQKWGQLSDDELQQTEGNVEQLVGLIQRKTGEAREHIEEFLTKLSSDSGSVMNEVAETVQQYTDSAVETLQEAGKQVTDSARASYIQAERTVRQRPAEALAVCFGTGLITGVVVGLLLRR